MTVKEEVFAFEERLGSDPGYRASWERVSKKQSSRYVARLCELEPEEFRPSAPAVTAHLIGKGL